MGVRAQSRCTSRGTSPWRASVTCRAACCTCATTCTRSSATGVPAFQVTPVDANPNIDIVEARAGHVRRSAVPDQQRAARRSLRARTRRAADPHRHVPRRVPLPDPASAADWDGAAHPARAIVYGHGLLGSTDEIEGFAPFVDRFRHRSLRHARDRHGGGRRAERRPTRSHDFSNVRLDPRSACSRAC